MAVNYWSGEDKEEKTANEVSMIYDLRIKIESYHVDCFICGLGFAKVHNYSRFVGVEAGKISV